jgi:hypothetical protein
MNDTVIIKIGLLALSGALVLTGNGFAHEVGQWNLGGLFSYLGGTAAGMAIMFRWSQSRRS